MKRLALLLAAVLAAFPLAAQQVDSTQIKAKTNGGLLGDTSNAIAVAPHRGTSAPSSPVTGQLWCDTNFTPCILKQYDGSAWNASTSVSVISTQTDLSSFPGSPSDGQLFYDKSHFQLWIYDGTAAAWYATNGSGAHTGSAIVDNFTGTKITDPTLGSMSAADNATAGNMTAGAHSFKITCANSTGGETLPTAYTASVTFTASHSYDLSNIPTCSGGPTTTRRGIYASKAGQAASGPWYWIGNIADNSTTSLTAQAGLADGNLVLLAPKVNYSAALNARWTFSNNTASTTSGGCGATGSSLVCSSSNSAPSNMGTTTSDATVRVAVDVSSYNTGDYTIQYRFTDISMTADHSDGNVSNVGLGGLRVNSANNERFYTIGAGVHSTGVCGGNVTIWTSPLTNRVPVSEACRGSVGGTYGQSANCSSTTCIGVFDVNVPSPAVLWIRFVKRSTTGFPLFSRDGVNWFYPINVKSAGDSNQQGSWDWSTNNPTQFEFDIQMEGNSTGARYYFQLDNFTLTVN